MRPRDFRPYRDPSFQPQREPGEGAPSAALPSFITGEPRPGGFEADASPTPEQSPASIQDAPEAGVGGRENAPGEAPFPGRGRRRRLRSPYGFNSSRQVAEEEPAAPSAGAVGDDAPATETD